MQCLYVIAVVHWWVVYLLTDKGCARVQVHDSSISNDTFNMRNLHCRVYGACTMLDVNSVETILSRLAQSTLFSIQDKVIGPYW